MADITAASPLLAADAERARILKRIGTTDVFFRRLTQSAAIFALLLLGGVIFSLIRGAWPTLSKFGLGFFTSLAWNPVTDDFGALASIYGTVVSSIIALIVAVPVGLGIAVFLTELSPQILRRPIGIAIELLAGIPSIIYGLWGFFVFVPFLQRTIQPALISTFEPVPILNQLFAGPPFGIGMLAAGLILAIMILPFIVSISRDVFETVPPMLRESAYGVGCTKWEVIRYVVIPFTRTGVVGGIMLALGRALGETMAVTFVVGNANRISASIIQPGTTISAKIASEFNEAADLHRSSLIALGLILFFITFIVLAAARYMLLRIERSSGA